MEKKNKTTLIMSLISIFAIIVIITGATFSYFAWRITEENATNITVRVEGDAAELNIVGDNITNNKMYPTTCDGNGALKGTTTVTAINRSDVPMITSLKIRASLFPTIGTLDENDLSKLHWAIIDTTTETENTCLTPDAQGTFENVAVATSLADFPDTTYTDIDTTITFEVPMGTTIIKTYEVYVWLDESYDSINVGETISDPMQDLLISVKWSEASTIEQCNDYKYQESILHGTDPELESGMIPVTISDTGAVTVADITQEWYNYGNKQWANAVLVNSTSRSTYINQDGTFNGGTPIPEDNILAYYVWIPRYSYKIPKQVSCSQLKDITIERYPECYAPYKLLNNDKANLIEWMEENGIASAQEILDKALVTGRIEILDMYVSVIYFIELYNEQTGSNIVVSMPFTMSNDDKDELSVVFWEMFSSMYPDYTLNQSKIDINNGLETGLLTITIEGETQSMPMNAFIDTANAQYGYDFMYSPIVNTNNVVESIVPIPIDIKFESISSEKSPGDAVNTYRTHPAFTFGNTEINGIWVGKFETGHNELSLDATENNLGCVDENCTNADGLIIKPNVASFTNNDISNFFYASRSMSRNGNPFGFNSTTMNTHMMKNSEWGAVAYLSHSQYGINEEVRINNYNNSATLTGCGAASANEETAETCDILYGTPSTEKNTYPQSTTGNITGIFDMSGGSYEYVMGNYNGTTGSSRFTTLPEAKYYDKYTMTSIDNCTLLECGGHALYETDEWYNYIANFVSESHQWFQRGGNYYNGDNAGAFNSNAANGNANNNNGFRAVLVKGA